MTLAIQEEILRFKVSVNYVLAVQVIQRANYLGCVETAGGPGESAGRSQIREQLTAGNELQQHVNPGLVPAAPEPEKTTGLKSRQAGTLPEQSRFLISRSLKKTFSRERDRFLSPV